MGKDKKKDGKGNVFKVAGAKSLKKTKAKQVNLGLKNIKQKIVEIDKELKNILSNPKPKDKSKKEIKVPQKKQDKTVSKEEVVSTTDKIESMDI